MDTVYLLDGLQPSQSGAPELGWRLPSLVVICRYSSITGIQASRIPAMRQSAPRTAQDALQGDFQAGVEV